MRALSNDSASLHFLLSVLLSSIHEFVDMVTFCSQHLHSHHSSCGTVLRCSINSYIQIFLLHSSISYIPVA